MKNPKAAVAATAILLAFVLVAMFFPTRERQVKKRFKALRDWVRVEEVEPPLQMAGKYNQALKLFADPLEVESEAYRISGKISAQEVAGAGSRWRTRFRKLDVDFQDLRVVFPADDEARATATGHLSGEGLEGNRFDETHELDITLKKGDDGWLFARLKIVQVLEK